MTEIELLVDFHKDAARQGPGSQRETEKALDLMGIGNPGRLTIADIGCGSGAQTITLAQNTNAQITAVDLFPQFLKKLDAQARALGFQDRIKTLAGSMEDLPFDHEVFDIIWSEGAIYNMGFKKGVTAWRPFLKTGGFLAVSEISWITNSRPKELEQYWEKEYPEIDTIPNKINVMRACGYLPVAQFILPPYCWLDNYYLPIKERFAAFLSRHQNSDMARRLVESHREEIRIYEEFQEFYSYGFYIARKM
jgi:ubiquinone/menaquinone biosynthesis C-methylase UbiE